MKRTDRDRARRETPRDLAVDLLVRIDDGAFTHVLVPAALAGSQLDARDRAFVTSLVSGAVRMQGALDFLVARVADRPVADLDPRVRAGLRLGVHQLLQGVPVHAAVGETVEAVGGRGRGYVNAVLRRVAALGPAWGWPVGDDPDALAVRTSHPRWLVEHLVDELGADDAKALLLADNEPAVLTLRANPQRGDARSLVEELRGAGAEAVPVALAPGAVRVRGAGDPGRLPPVREGRATPQDAASQAVVALVDPLPRTHVVEVGAAPGGKATALAELDATVTAIDLDGGRLGLVRAAAQRLGVRVAAVRADGRALPVAEGRAQRVLLDAPCSGLGVLRRRPDARWRLSPESISVLAALQRDLLEQAARVVAPGGVLVYSVCTVSRAETLGVDEWAREALEGFEALDVPGSPWRSLGRGALLLPQARGTDGMYVLRLRRAAPPVG